MEGFQRILDYGRAFSTRIAPPAGPLVAAIGLGRMGLLF
jgi:hypothetical protein